MQINLEAADNHSIKSYSDSQIKIQSTLYEDSFIVSRNEIIIPWPIHSLQELNEATMEPLLKFQPEIIIIGHNQPGILAPTAILEQLSKLRIGIECMSIGAASRTFNILLSEQRTVVAGFIF